MCTILRAFVASGLALALVFSSGSSLSAQDVNKKTDATDQEMTVLERGPIHEAFAQPTPKNPQPSPPVPKKPPVPVPEQPPELKPKGDNVQWIPGYWSWDPERKDFVWVSGFWRVPPPDRQWVPGHWTKRDEGWQWAPGYWGEA